jgi:hypothetical protein
MPLPLCSSSSPSDGWRALLLLLCCCPWWPAADCGRSGGSGLNKLVGSGGAGLICRSGLGVQGEGSHLVARHGDEDGRDFVSLCCCCLDLQQRSDEATPGSIFTVALPWLLYLMVVRRLLPPPSSASIFFGRRMKANNNLQAAMPRWRPLCSSSVRSRRLTPSGLVPGGDSFGRAVMLRCGEKGAGPDCVPKFRSRVLYAKYLDLFVIFYFSWSCMSMYHHLWMNESF